MVEVSTGYRRNACGRRQCGSSLASRCSDLAGGLECGWVGASNEAIRRGRNADAVARCSAEEVLHALKHTLLMRCVVGGKQFFQLLEELALVARQLVRNLHIDVHEEIPAPAA